jgi:hypothetical protein
LQQLGSHARSYRRLGRESIHAGGRSAASITRRGVVDASAIVGCTGIVVDAKDEDAERFYTAYDLVTITTEAPPPDVPSDRSCARDIEDG